MLQPNRFFDPDPHTQSIALELYARIKDLSLVCPHGHVDPALFSTPGYRFGNPAELFIQPDHYVLRMLYSQGISYEQLLAKDKPRDIWRLFAHNMHLFAGTPSGIWLAHSLESVFGITEKLGDKNADAAYDQPNPRNRCQAIEPQHHAFALGCG